METTRRPHRARWIIPLLAACAAVAIGGALYLASTFDPCQTVVRELIPSPDGSNSIVVFGRECGATVGFNTQVSIAPTGSSFSSDKYPAFFVVSGLQDVVARWLGQRAVEIAVIPGAEKVYRREERVGDIRIIYP
jgi:hypothetical protein